MKAVRTACAQALGIAMALVVGLSLAGSAGAQTAESCGLDVIELRGDFGKARFGVDIADDDAERNQGLMFRDTLPASRGMLFVYPEAGQPRFWMKNTLIALDMVFVTPQGVVQHVHEGAQPGDLTPIDGGDGVLAVLEIKGGLARAIGIGPGTELRHPAFGADAAWPCDGATADTGGQ